MPKEASLSEQALDYYDLASFPELTRGERLVVETVRQSTALLEASFSNRTAELEKVMGYQHGVQEEKTMAAIKRLRQESREMQKQYEKLRKQLLLDRSTLPELLIVAFALIALGFFLSGLLFTTAKTLFLFGILGALPGLLPGTLSLFLSRKVPHREISED